MAQLSFHSSQRGLYSTAHVAIGLLQLLLCCTEGIWSSKAIQAFDLRQGLGLRAGTINLLQWNPHAECFLNCKQTGLSGHCDKSFPQCRDGAIAFLKELLSSGEGGVDFAGIEQLEDEDFLQNGLSMQDWGQFTYSCGDNGFGIYPFDIATLFYRKSRWQPKEIAGKPLQPQQGCMERVHKTTGANNYRAFVAQAFRQIGSGLEVIVVAAHFPHVQKYAEEIALLRDSLQALRNQTGINKMILIADSNQHKESQLVMEDIDADAGAVASSELHATCCYPIYLSKYDRIIAAGFPHAKMQTTLPFGDPGWMGLKPTHKIPGWVAENMHDPVFSTLTFDAKKFQYAQSLIF